MTGTIRSGGTRTGRSPSGEPTLVHEFISREIKARRQANEETGVLTWEIKLKPNETKKYRISYKIKYPKDKVIGNL